jgi:hypothetical protein
MKKSEVHDTGTGDGGPADPEWQSRRLCSDENCIGVIGPDGRCKECGKPYTGDLDPVTPDPQPIPVQGTPAADPPSEEAERPQDEWKNRRLCRDENCIGVIGPDGRCKECGKPYSG